MNRRFYNAVEKASEFRAFIVLIIVLSIRAYRAIPHLRPINLFIPLSISQIILFIITAFNPRTFPFMFSAGNFAITCFAIIPLLFQKPTKAHWVK